MKIKNKEIAKNLIKLGINIDDIIKATGLSKEEIEKLLKDKWFFIIVLKL